MESEVPLQRSNPPLPYTHHPHPLSFPEQKLRFNEWIDDFRLASFIGGREHWWKRLLVFHEM